MNSQSRQQVAATEFNDALRQMENRARTLSVELRIQRRQENAWRTAFWSQLFQQQGIPRRISMRSRMRSARLRRSATARLRLSPPSPIHPRRLRRLQMRLSVPPALPFVTQKVRRYELRLVIAIGHIATNLNAQTTTTPLSARTASPSSRRTRPSWRSRTTRTPNPFRFGDGVVPPSHVVPGPRRAFRRNVK